jgi:peptidoglycan/xylan/chitin deacetylase (PgdA/CDA1 family)
MRADRLATLYFFDPVRRFMRLSGSGIPILMYHRIPEEDTCTTHPYYCTNTAVPVFEQQIAFLHRSGYRSVSVTEAFRLAQARATGEKLVAITFDDGYQDFYTNAFPVLNRYGYSATVYLPTAYIGDSSRRFKETDCLTWSQVRELRKAGIEFGSHTVTHPQLRNVGPEQLRQEIRDSKLQIEEKLGEPAETFAYPYAFPEGDRGFVERLRGVLSESGYRSGVSTIIGRARISDNPFHMRRLPANSHDDLRLFQTKLEGGYDWLHTLQYAAKLRPRRLNSPEAS